MPEPKLIWDERFELYHSQGIEVSIFLSNGIRLIGKILKFDDSAVVLSSDKGPEGVTVQRSIIATLMRYASDRQHQQHPQENQQRAPRGR